MGGDRLLHRYEITLEWNTVSFPGRRYTTGNEAHLSFDQQSLGTICITTSSRPETNKVAVLSYQASRVLVPIAVNYSSFQSSSRSPSLLQSRGLPRRHTRHCADCRRICVQNERCFICLKSFSSFVPSPNPRRASMRLGHDHAAR